MNAKIISEYEFVKNINLYSDSSFTKSESNYLSKYNIFYYIDSIYTYDKKKSWFKKPIKIIIHKKEDDWYVFDYIYDNKSLFYLCDGFDEVKELVEHYLKINK